MAFWGSSCAATRNSSIAPFTSPSFSSAIARFAWLVGLAGTRRIDSGTRQPLPLRNRRETEHPKREVNRGRTAILFRRFAQFSFRAS